MMAMRDVGCLHPDGPNICHIVPCSYKKRRTHSDDWQNENQWTSGVCLHAGILANNKKAGVMDESPTHVGLVAPSRPIKCICEKQTNPKNSTYPMGLLDLITGLGTRPNDTYNRFLDAYSKLRQMKDVGANVEVLTECLTSEREAGESRCLQYAQTHGIDKAILQLHASAEIEPFLVAMFQAAGRSYLDGEVSHLVWRYGSFPRLVLVLCELCVVHSVYNSSLARHICDIFPAAHPQVYSGLILLVPLEAYSSAFAGMGLGQRVIGCANSLLSQLSSASFPAIDFLGFYEDVSKQQLVEQLDFTGARKARVEKSPAAHPSSEIYADSLLFLADLFSEIKTRKLRRLLIAHSVCLIQHPGYSNFIASCIEADPSLMAGMLANNKNTNSWSPLKLSRTMCNILCCGDSVDKPGSVSRSLFSRGSEQMCSNLATPDGGARSPGHTECSGTGPDDNPPGAGGKDGMASPDLSGPQHFATLSSSEECRGGSCMLLQHLIKSRFSDIRTYLFLYSVNKPAFFANFHEIVGICDNKSLLVKAIYDDVMHGSPQ